MSKIYPIEIFCKECEEKIGESKDILNEYNYCPECGAKDSLYSDEKYVLYEDDLPIMFEYRYNDVNVFEIDLWDHFSNAYYFDEKNNTIKTRLEKNVTSKEHGKKTREFSRVENKKLKKAFKNNIKDKIDNLYFVLTKDKELLIFTDKKKAENQL